MCPLRGDSRSSSKDCRSCAKSPADHTPARSGSDLQANRRNSFVRPRNRVKRNRQNQPDAQALSLEVLVRGGKGARNVSSVDHGAARVRQPREPPNETRRCNVLRGGLGEQWCSEPKQARILGALTPARISISEISLIQKYPEGGVGSSIRAVSGGRPVSCAPDPRNVLSRAGHGPSAGHRPGGDLPRHVRGIRTWSTVVTHEGLLGLRPNDRRVEPGRRPRRRCRWRARPRGRCRW